ncbi:MAG: response regulator [Firmicutes bacterium]|nr:response regulator [Bacillota bacterium]
MTPSLPSRVRLVILEHEEEARSDLKKVLETEGRIEILGEAAGGQEALRLVRELSPDCILIDGDMPELEGLTAAETINLEAPHVGIIIVSAHGGQEQLRRAMAAGAREYLTRPIAPPELIDAVMRVAALGRKRRELYEARLGGQIRRKPGAVVSVFSAKGGVGKTTIATNLAVSLVRDFGKQVVLADLDLQFGDVTVMLDLVPQRSFADIGVDRGGPAAASDPADLESCLSIHSTGLKVLAAPPRPEEAELVTASCVGSALDTLRTMFEFVVVDTPPFFQDTVLAALDRSDQILLVASLDLPTAKNVKLSMDVMARLKYPKEKVRLVLNRSSKEIGMQPELLERHLGLPISNHIPSDGRIVVEAANRGVPFVVAHPRAPISASLRRLAASVCGIDGDGGAEALSGAEARGDGQPMAVAREVSSLEEARTGSSSGSPGVFQRLFKRGRDGDVSP